MSDWEMTPKNSLITDKIEFSWMQNASYGLQNQSLLTDIRS